MKANNLTISIPYKGCNKGCPYCVSRSTGMVKTNEALMQKNLPKILELARRSQVSSVLLTGKGEPCLNMNAVNLLTDSFKEFPVELQTNGIWFNQHLEAIDYLAAVGMNVIAISRDDFQDVRPSGVGWDENDFRKVVNRIISAGMILRVTFNVTKGEYTFKELFTHFKKIGVDQLTLRNIVAPHFTGDTLQNKWIAQNVTGLYDKLNAELKEACNTKGHHLRTLPYGSKVYDLDGLAVSYSDYCIQDENNTEDIRSLIFQEDGHCYSSWNSKASILF